MLNYISYGVAYLAFGGVLLFVGNRIEPMFNNSRSDDEANPVLVYTIFVLFWPLMMLLFIIMFIVRFVQEIS
jgi:hypothetical protein